MVLKPGPLVHREPGFFIEPLSADKILLNRGNYTRSLHLNSGFVRSFTINKLPLNGFSDLQS